MSEPCGRGSAPTNEDPPTPAPRLRRQIAERLAVMAVSFGASAAVVGALAVALGTL